MAAVTHAPNSVLDALESAVGAILLQTGAIFDEPDYSDSRRFSRTKLRLDRVLPQRLTGIHNALDSLEAELVRARTIMQNDLNDARTSRLALERSKAQEVALSTTDQPPKVEAPEGDKVSPPQPSQAAAHPTTTQGSGADVIMLDESASTASAPLASHDDGKIKAGEESSSSSQLPGSATQPQTNASRNQQPQNVVGKSTDGSAVATAPTGGATATSAMSTTADTGAPKDAPNANDNSTQDQQQQPPKVDGWQSETGAEGAGLDSSMPFDRLDSASAIENDSLLSGLDMYGGSGNADGLNDVGNFDMPNPVEDMNTADFLDTSNLSNSGIGDFTGFGDMANQEFDIDSFIDIDGSGDRQGTAFDKMEFDDDFFNTNT